MKTFERTHRNSNLLYEFKNTLISIALLLGLVASANAATKTWTNGGGTNNWGDATNWSPSGVPGAADAVVYNSTYLANCNMNVQVNVASLTISTGYTGTITQMAGDSIVMSGNWTQSAGTFTGGNKRIDINGGLTIGTCTFTSTTGALYVQNSFVVNASGVFNHNNGTAYFDQAGATTIQFPGNNAAQFYNVVFNSSVGTTIQAGDTIVVNGTLSLLQNQVKTGVIRLATGSSIITDPAFTGGNAVLDIQAPLNITPLSSAFCGVRVNNAGAVFNAPAFAFTCNMDVSVNAGTFNGGTYPIAVNGTFRLSGGTFNSTSSTLSIDGSFSHTAGTFTHNSGTVAFTSATAATFSNGGRTTFYNASITKSALANTFGISAATDTMKVAGALALSTGTLSGGYIQLSGTALSVGATTNFTVSSTLLLITGTGTYTIPAACNIPGTVLNNASATVSFGAGATPVFKGAVTVKAGTWSCNSTPWVMSLALSITGGTFNASSATTTYSNAALIISTGATFNHNNGSWVFSSPAANVTVTNTLKTLFYDLTINLGSGVSTTNRFSVSASDTVVAVNSLTLTAGNLYSGIVEARGAVTEGVGFGNAAMVGVLIIANGSTSRNIALVSQYQPGLTINDASASVNAPTGNIVGFGSTFKLLAGEFFPDAYAITITGAYTQSGGTFWNGTANVTHSSTTAISGGDYYPTSATATFTGTFTLSGGNFDQGSGNVTHSSTLTISGGNYYPTTGTTTVTGAFSQTGGVVQGGGGIMNFNSTFGLATGTFNPPSATMTITGATTITSGTYTAGTRKQVFNGTLTINGGNFTSTSDTTVIGNSSLTIAAAATWSNNNGTYDFNRAAGGITVANPTSTRSFYNVRINLTNATASSARFTETAGNTIAVTNNLALVAGNIYTGGTIQLNGLLTDGGSFGGGIGVLTVTGGAGSRTLSFTSANVPGIIVNDASATVRLATAQAATVNGVLTLTTGTINPGSYAATVTGAYSQAAGTFAAGTAAVTFSSTFGLTGGTFNPPSALQTVTGAYTQSAGTFAAGTSPITFSSTFTLSGGTFNPPSALTIITGAYAQTVGTVTTNTGKISMRSTVTMTTGTFAAPSDTLEFQGAATISIAAAVTFSHNNGTIAFANSTGNATFTIPATLNVYNFYVNLSNATNNILTTTAGNKVSVANKATLVAGKINTGIVELKGDISNLTSFNGGSATILVANGTGPRTVNLPGTTIGNLTISDANVTMNGPTTGTLALQGNFSLTAGTYVGGAGNVTVAGTFTQGASTTFTGGAGNFTVTGAYSISGASAAFTAPSGNLTFSGAVTITSPATFAHNNGTVTFNGGANQTLAYTTAGNLTLKNLAVNTTGGAELRPNISTGYLVLTGNLAIGSAGILNLSTNSEDLDISGNYNDQNAAGGLTYGTRTVTFKGGSAQTVDGANGTENFYNVTMSNTSGGVTLNTGMYVNHTLALTAATNCKVILNNANLTINSAATITGGTTNEYVVTGGSGYLRQENVGPTGRSGNIVYPVGPTTTNYTPVTLKNTGTNDRFDVHIFTHALTAGTTGSPIYSAAIDQTYMVEEQTAGGSNVTLTIQWNANNELPGFDRTNCGIKHYTGGHWVTEGSLGLATGAGPYTSTAAGITSFSPFDEGSGGGELPVELASFTGNADNGKVALHWTTEVEVNNNYFTLERSTDGVEFTELTRVEGNGNSTIENNYSYMDVNPAKGTNYYRLKQTDFNGEFEYKGGIVAVNMEKPNTTTSTITASPNPLEGREIKVKLDVVLAAYGNVEMNLTDVTGKTVYHNEFSKAQEINVVLPENLAKGMYFLQVKSGPDSYSQKLIVR